MTSPNAGRVPSSVFLLDGKPYQLVEEAEAKQVDGIRRRWDVRRVTRQDGDPEPEFSIPLETFSVGSGISYGLLPGGYESADGWDLSAPGKAIPWPLLASAEDFEYDYNTRGWEYYSFPANYLYVFRAGYAIKYEPNPTPGSVWPILEIHYFGANRVVGGKWAEYNGEVYVPLIDPTDDSEQEFAQLTTINTPVTEVQLLTETGSPTGGTFTIEYDDGITDTTTPALAFDITAADLQTALRAIPGLQRVTVARSGTTTDFVWTVTMTAAATEDSAATVPSLVVDDAGLTGGTAPAVTQSVSVAGTGDVWTVGPNGIVARYFTAWNKPGVGPVLALCQQNMVQLNGGDPMTGGDWGAEYPVDNSTYRCTALAVWDRYLMVGKQNGLYSFDDQAVAILETKDLAGVIDDANFVGMVEAGGYILAPHKNGLLRWAPGRYRFVGAEADGLLEGQVATGWGRYMGVTPYGRYAYTSLMDSANALGIVGSLVAQGGSSAQAYSATRGPLTPHMHQQFPSSAEDIIASTIQSNPARPDDVVSGADLSSVGTIAWTNPNNIATADAEVTALGPGTTHYEKALMPAVTRVPVDATVDGIEVSVDAKAIYYDIDFVAVATGSYAAPATDAVTVNVPTGTADGDVMIAAMVSEGQPNVPSGWTAISGGRTLGASWLQFMYRVAASEPASYTIITNPGSTHGVAYIATYRHVDTSTPIDVGISAGTEVTATTVAAPSVVTATQNAWLISTFASLGASSFSQPTGMTERADQNATSALTLSLDDEEIATPGATGTRTSAYGAGATTLRAFSFALRPAARPGGTHDSSVRLVVGGSVVGDDLAAVDEWAGTRTTRTWGGPMELWGLTPTPAQVNAADFGFVLSALITAGTATLYGIATIKLFFTNANGDPGAMLIVIRVDADGVTAQPYAYQLARAGLPVANDPNISHAISDASFKSSRIFQPSRNTQKTWRSVEFHAGIDPEGSNTPGGQMWASVDDGTPFALLDAAGDPLTARASDDYEGFFPNTVNAIGRWVQIIPTVPALSGAEVAVSFDVRDITLHGSFAPKMTDYVTAVCLLKDNPKLADGTTDRRTAMQQYTDLLALCGPRPAGSAPIAVHDPETGEDTTCMVTGEPRLLRVQFQNASAPDWVVVITLRKTPRATG